MCGIFGGIGASAKEVKTALENINRGFEGITVKEYGDVLMGHRRHLVKESHKKGVKPGESDQPYESIDKKTSMVFNGEFFNFLEFKNGEFKNEKFETDGDTEVLFKLYEKEGISFLKRTSTDIDAMFSIAVLDQKEDKLFVFRDWPGRLPLFYYYDQKNKKFLYSSQLSGFLTIPSLDINIAEELTPGTFLTLDLKTFELKKETFYKVKPLKKEQELLDIGQELHKRLHQSAKNRTMGDVPICTMLSGGIDSLLTTYYVLSNIDFKRVDYKPMSYVYAVEGFDSPDVYRAKVAAEGFKYMGLTLKEIRSTADQLVNDIPNILRLFEMRKIKALSVYPLPIYYYLAPEMKKDGFKVTIGGHGVDELMGAYDNWKELNKTHEVQSSYPARLAFINNIYENMMRRASIIFMERGPIEARFPFLQKDVCEYMLGIDPKWLQMNPKNAELLLKLIETKGGERSQWGDKLPWIYNYLTKYLDNNGQHTDEPGSHERAEVEKLFWKLPLMVAGMHASDESPMPFHLLFNAKLRGQHGSGISSLEEKIVKKYADLGNTDIEIYRAIVKKTFRLNDSWAV